MKKLIAFTIISLLFILPVGAVENDIWPEQNPVLSLYDEQLRASGADDLMRSLPEDAADSLRRAGVSMDSPGSPPDLSNLLDIIIETTKHSAKAPMGVAAMLLGIIVLCALLEGAKEAAGDKSLHGTASSASTLTVCLVAAVPIAAFITATAETISGACNFAGVFVPVFAAVMAVSGQTATAAGYSAFMMAVLEGCSAILANIAVPLLKIFLAVSVTAATVPSFKIDSIVTAFEKNIKWILAFFASLLVGALGVSSMVASSADQATARALKFAVTSGVPVVGSALGDAIGSVQGCVGLLRSTVGGFGIIAIAFIFIPPVISCVLWRMCIGVCNFAAEAFGVKPVARLLKSIGAVLSILLSILIFAAVVLIISSALVLKGTS